MKLATKHRKQLAAAGLPEKAIVELFDMYYNYMVQEVRVHADPYVDGTFAVRLVKEDTIEYKHDGVSGWFTYLDDVDLLWDGRDYEECEFETWPPVAEENNLKFL